MTGRAAADREWQRRRRRPYLLTAGAVAVSVALLAVAWAIDRGRQERPSPVRTRPRPVAELVTPAPLSPQERAGDGPRFGSQESVRLEKGAWVQVADRAGNLKQQYTATRIDPLPDKRLAMAEPRAVLYGDGGRIVTMRSDTMTARVPKRELESGKLSGDVVIRIYRPRDGKPVDLTSDAPDVTIESPEATFDSASGEIRCDRQVRISGAVITFVGEGLSLTLGAGGKSIERLVIDRPLAPVRISRSAAEAEARKKRSDAGAGARGAAMLACAAPPPGTPTAPAPDGRLFVLSLHDDVEIVSREGERTTVVRGDRVDAYFVLKGGPGVGLAAAGRSPAHAAPPREVALHGTLPERLAAVAIAAGAAGPPEPEDGEVVVTYAGKLVLVPAGEDVPPLARPDGVRMVVRGTPARVEDSLSEAVITADRATFESLVERVDLEGTVGSPATVETPDFTLGARHFALDRSTGRGRSDGPGTIVMGGAGSKPLVVSWGTRMALELEPGTGDAEGSFRGAEFTGEVDARSPDFEMQAAQLAVEAEPAGRKDVPRRIVAAGGVTARALGSTKGRFAAERVEIALSPNAAGDAQPRTLVATGGIMAGDDAQTLWASALRTTFVERPAPAPGAAGTDPAGSELGAIAADGPVELLLDDGTRVFASRLEGDGLGRNARLIGPDVLVVRGNLVLDQLADVQVQEVPARMSALGAGRASSFRDPVLPRQEGRTGRPRIPGVPQMQATWRDSLAFADGAGRPRDGGPSPGLLLLSGKVKVRASRDPRQAEALDADEVQVELLPRSAAARPREGSDAGMQQVGAMRASGEVRLEAREWAEPSRSGDPRIFRMNAPNVTYDVALGSAAVDGAGSLLVFDPPAPVAPERADDRRSPFSADGTTRFTWQRSLAMDRRPDGTSRIVLEREVVMDHLGPSTEATGTVSADRMIAIVKGMEGPRAAAADGAVALGGPAELTDVSADGRVVVRTSDMDIEAGEFELQVPTQVGIARADVGRVVTVIRRGSAAPMRAHAVRWDLAKGTLSVEGARGGIGR